MDSRVHDYLDDKLQSAADLESLDSLLANVQEQQTLLKKQLDDARRDHDEAQSEAQQHADLIQRKARHFHAEQEHIDRRQLMLTQSETSDDAVQKFDESMARLRKLEVAAEYVELLKEVHALRQDSESKLGKDDDAALIPYQTLQQLTATLKPLQDAAEGAAPHLLDHINRVVQGLGDTIRRAFSQSLQRLLQKDKLNWPKTSGIIPAALEKAWAINIGRLLDLQKKELEAEEQSLGKDRRSDPSPLLPFEVLVQPLQQRFDYHFSGNKPTNRLDKPEYFLNHITDLVAQYSDFVQDSIQPILLKHFQRSDLAFTPAYIDATSALITALLPMIRKKLDSVANQVASNPALLSHLVQEVISFDNILKDSYSYAPSSPSADWPGLAFYLLDTRGYFQQWLAAERDFALSRYQAILEAPDAGEIDFDGTAADTTKPSKAALRLNDLLETITERYRDISSYSQRIDFLIDIQIKIFDTYHQRLQDALDAYLSLTSTIGRAVHTGLTKEELAELQGVKGLDRICRIFGSADYLERAMRDWSDDVFFIELWAELDYRHKNRDSGIGHLGNWQEIQQKTSSALGSETDGGLEGALFDETANSYRRLRARAEKVLVDAIKYDVQNVLKPYSAVNTWASLSSSANRNAVSAELDPTLNLLSEYLGFLRKALGKAPLRRVARQICHALDDYLFRYVLHGRSHFSTAGATQLTTDLQALCLTIDRYVGPSQAQIGMQRVLEGVTLLSLPVRGEISRVQASTSGDDDASAWDEDDDGAGNEEEGGSKMSLFQAERLVFMDNESARHALEQLGLETLSEQDARSILRQRVEISS
ncbi:hypothetical protein AC579_8842 [Pseudocercospora musae]|uniref:RINT-1 family protein n=1 Tax=Pseudocercospora musae TaxID=113226 RepID=A0A139IGW4_9PEZI|nr:hypothetical protein AC579_8842 [Pseudocercospora musae]